MLGGRKMRKSSEIIEDHVKTLEEMIDIMDDMWEAEKQGKWRQVENAKHQLYNAKLMYKDYLDEYIDRRIETFCIKNDIQSLGDIK
jgi:oligoribonuclease (3'-5' exoribonuclease)